jgi:Zn-dependent protease with chaperone function
MRTLALLFALALLLLSIPMLLLTNMIGLGFHWTDIVLYLVIGGVLYLILAIVGWSLNRKFSAAVDGFVRGEVSDLIPSRSLLRTFGLLLVVLLPYLLFLLLLSVYLAAAFGLYGFWAVAQLPRVPVAILVGLAVVVLGTAIGFFIGLYRLVFPPKTETFGEDLLPDQQSELWAMSRSVATSVGTKPADRIVLTPDPGISVHLSGPLPITLLGGGTRVLQLGIPSLHQLTVAELQAILAHEYGHFSNRDTQWSTFTYALGNGLWGAFKATPGPLQGEPSFFSFVLALNPGYWTLFLFLKLFSRVTGAFSRIREVMADIRAMKLYGGESFAKGLAKVAFNDAVFAGIVQGEVIPSLLKEDKVVNNLATIMRLVSHDLPDEQRKELTSALSSAEVGEYDSHPPFATRLGYARRFPTPPNPQEERDASGLFEEWDALNERVAEMYNQRLFAYLAALERARGAETQAASA